MSFVLWAPHVQYGDGIGFVSLEMIQCSSWLDWSQRNRFTKCDGLHCYFLKLTFLFIPSLMPKLGAIKVDSFWPSDFLLALESNKTDKNTPRSFFLFWFRVNIKGILWVTDQVLVQKSRLNIWYSNKTKVAAL